MRVPPPLPPEPSRDEQIAAVVHPRGRPTQTASTAPPKRGLSGCAIAAIIGASLLVVAVPVVAILAAIAIPQYQQYVLRSHIQEAYNTVAPKLDEIDAFREQNGTCPNNRDLGYGEEAFFGLGGADGSINGRHARFTVGALDTGACAVEVVFGQLSPAVNGKTLVFESTADGWYCFGGTLEAPYRPFPCRPDNTTSTRSSP